MFDHEHAAWRSDSLLVGIDEVGRGPLAGPVVAAAVVLPKGHCDVGVERVFPLHGPVWASIEVVRRGRVRRAKLYYLRNLSGKRARIKEKRDR